VWTYAADIMHTCMYFNVNLAEILGDARADPKGLVEATGGAPGKVWRGS